MRTPMFRCVVVASLSACAVVALGGCGAAVGEVRTGVPHAARPPSCALTFETVTPADMQPGARFGAGGEFEQVGMVSLGTTQGTDPMSEAVRQEVRPRACGMGGEAISLMMSGDGANRRGYAQTNIVFLVWAHPQQRPTTPQAF